jgi:glycogen operon protein
MLSWFDWAGLDGTLRDFTARLVRARLGHPALHADRPLTGRGGEELELPDVAWQRLDGAPMAETDWREARSLAMLLHHAGDRVLVAMHGEVEAATLALPAPRPGHVWHLLADSGDPQRMGEADPALPHSPRSVLLLAETSQA